MKIVIDSNIVFSAILNTESKISYLIINGSKYFDFYSPGLLKYEILKHKEKILRLSNYSESQFNEVFESITKRITFVDELLISDDELFKAYEIVKDIDQNDALFLALAYNLKASLWTGDKQLIKGLR